MVVASPSHTVVTDPVPVTSEVGVVELLAQSDIPIGVPPLDEAHSGASMNKASPETATETAVRQAGRYGGAIGLGLVVTGGGAAGFTSGVVDHHSALLTLGIALIIVGALLVIAGALLTRNLGQQLGG
jgi:hypothetical protein